jgi:hypothetical protein
MPKSQHFWRIHAKVTKRLWADIPLRTREIIANDVAHETSEFQWFTTKVNADATRLYEDSDYYDNAEFTFRHSKHEPLAKAVV